jgi:hypothetical protein
LEDQDLHPAGAALQVCRLPVIFRLQNPMNCTFLVPFSPLTRSGCWGILTAGLIVPLLTISPIRRDRSKNPFPSRFCPLNSTVPSPNVRCNMLL